jgi:hypothetical protein
MVHNTETVRNCWNYEKRTVKIGCGALDKPMTAKQAEGYGDRRMPSYLKRAGFKTSIFISDVDINGSLFYRISYGKVC